MTALDYTIKPRHVRFDWKDTPIQWIPGDPSSTHIINILNLLFPAGELWFCRVYNKALPLITDARLRELITLALQDYFPDSLTQFLTRNLPQRQGSVQIVSILLLLFTAEVVVACLSRDGFRISPLDVHIGLARLPCLHFHVVLHERDLGEWRGAVELEAQRGRRGRGELVAEHVLLLDEHRRDLGQIVADGRAALLALLLRAPSF